MPAGRIGAAWTQHTLSAYNAALRQYVTDNHFMDTFQFHAISGREVGLPSRSALRTAPGRRRAPAKPERERRRQPAPM